MKLERKTFGKSRNEKKRREEKEEDSDNDSISSPLLSFLFSYPKLFLSWKKKK